MEGSPYYIEDIVVLDGASVTILPGVQVLFSVLLIGLESGCRFLLW